jgi:hypothetical protein
VSAPSLRAKLVVTLLRVGCAKSDRSKERKQMKRSAKETGNQVQIPLIPQSVTSAAT